MNDQINRWFWTSLGAAIIAILAIIAAFALAAWGRG